MKKQILHTAIIISALFSLFSCAPNLVNMKKIEKPIPSNIAKLEKTNEYKKFIKNNNRIVLYDGAKIKVDYNEEKGFVIEKEYHQIYKSIRGQKFTHFIIANENEVIISLSARTIKASGKILPLEMKDVYVEDISRYTTVDSNKTKKVKYNFKNIEDGDTIEYILTTREERKKPPYFSYNTVLENGWPTLIYNLTIDIPTKMANSEQNNLFTRQKIGNKKRVTLAESTYSADEQKRTVFSWSAQLIPKRDNEPNRVCNICQKETIYFNITPWKTWKEMSKKLYDFYVKETLVSSELVTKKAKEIVNGISDEKKKIRALATFVQHLYTTYTYSIHYYKLNSPDVVLRRGYGTESELALLLVSLLHSIGIENAHLALIRTLQDTPLDIKVMRNFFSKRAVVCSTKDGQEIWLDPTYYQSDNNKMSAQTENRQALILTKDGSSKIKMTPEATAEQNSAHYALSYTIDSTMNLKTAFKGEFTGNYAYRSQDAVTNAPQNLIIEGAAHSLDQKYFNALVGDNGSIKNLKYSDPKNKHEKVFVSFDATINALRKSSYNDTYLLDIFPFNRAHLYPSPDLSLEKRETPILLGSFNTTSAVTIDITYPTNTLELVTLPKKQTLNIDGNKVQLTYSAEEKETGHIVVTLAFTRNAKVLSADKFEEVRTFYLALKKIFKEQLIFKKR